MIKKCCVCSKIRMDGKWRHGSVSNAPGRITHAYCPACFAKTMARIRRHASCRMKKPQNLELEGVLYGT